MTDWRAIADRWTATCGSRGEHINCPLGSNARCLVDNTTAAERKQEGSPVTHINQNLVGKLGVKINFPGYYAVFEPGGKRHLIEVDHESASFGQVGQVAVNGEVRFADGTKAWCILEIDESSSGEHCGTGVFVSDGIAWQDEDNFCERLGKTREQVFPYKYK